MSMDPLSAIAPVVSAARLAWTVWKACKAAPGSFGNISAEVLSLHAVLKEVEETLAGQKLSSSRQTRLETITSGCRSLLEDLEALVQKYESLGSQSKRTWDRLNWDAGEISELRARLTSNIVMLTAFMSTCQVVVEQKLNQLIQEFRDGKHEGSVLTVATVESLGSDEQETWRTIRKELEDIGISVMAFDANKEYIMGWFQEAIQTGAFEEQKVLDDFDSAVGDEDSVQSFHAYRPATALEDSRKAVPLSETVPIPILEVARPTSPWSDQPRPAPSLTSPGTEPSTRVDMVQPHEVKVSSTIRQRRIVALFTSLRGYNNAFIEACQLGKLSKAEELLKKGADINGVYTGSKTYEKGCTALFITALKFDFSLASWLLDHGADAQAMGSNQDTILHRLVTYATYNYSSALELRMRDMLRILIHGGAALNSTDMEGFTPLALSIKRQIPFQSIIDLLLQNGADPNCLCPRGWMPLMFAVSNGFPNIVGLLLEHGSQVDLLNHEKDTALLIAVRARETDIVHQLLNRGASVSHKDRFGKTALCYAVQTRNSNAVQALLNHYANPNDKTLLQSAYERLNDPRPLLEVAIRLNLKEIAILLIKSGAYLNNESSPFGKKEKLEKHILHLAIKTSDRDVVALMVENGANLEVKNTVPATALDMAVADKDMKLALFLLELGAKNNHEFYYSGGFLQEYGSTENMWRKIMDGYDEIARLKPSS